MDRQEQGRQTRESILHAAAVEFARQGYNAASLTDIAAVIGKPKTALRYHFNTKRELALGVLERQFQIWGDMQAGVGAGDRRGLDALFTLFGATASDLQHSVYANAAIVLILDAPLLDFQLPHGWESWAGIIERCIRQAQSSGEIDPAVDATQASENLINASLGVHRRFLHKLDRVDLVGQLWNIWLPLLRGMGADTPEDLLERARSAERPPGL